VKDFQKTMRKLLTLESVSHFEKLFELLDFWWEREAGFMPASRRRSISPPTQLRKADLGTQEFCRC
jgi:hypothetical protein